MKKRTVVKRVEKSFTFPESISEMKKQLDSKKATAKAESYLPQSGDRVLVTGVFNTTKGFMGVVQEILIPHFLNRREAALKYKDKWVKVIGTLSRPSYPKGNLVQRGGGLELELESIEILTDKGVTKGKVEILPRAAEAVNNYQE